MRKNCVSRRSSSGDVAVFFYFSLRSPSDSTTRNPPFRRWRVDKNSLISRSIAWALAVAPSHRRSTVPIRSTRPSGISKTPIVPGCVGDAFTPHFRSGVAAMMAASCPTAIALLTQCWRMIDLLLLIAARIRSAVESTVDGRLRRSVRGTLTLHPTVRWVDTDFPRLVPLTPLVRLPEGDGDKYLQSNIPFLVIFALLGGKLERYRAVSRLYCTVTPYLAKCYRNCCFVGGVSWNHNRRYATLHEGHKKMLRCAQIRCIFYDVTSFRQDYRLHWRSDCLFVVDFFNHFIERSLCKGGSSDLPVQASCCTVVFAFPAQSEPVVVHTAHQHNFRPNNFTITFIGMALSIAVTDTHTWYANDSPSSEYDDKRNTRKNPAGQLCTQIELILSKLHKTAWWNMRNGFVFLVHFVCLPVNRFGNVWGPCLGDLFCLSRLPPFTIAPTDRLSSNYGKTLDTGQGTICCVCFMLASGRVSFVSTFTCCCSMRFAHLHTRIDPVDHRKKGHSRKPPAWYVWELLDPGVVCLVIFFLLHAVCEQAF